MKKALLEGFLQAAGIRPARTFAGTSLLIAALRLLDNHGHYNGLG